MVDGLILKIKKARLIQTNMNHIASTSHIKLVLCFKT